MAIKLLWLLSETTLAMTLALVLVLLLRTPLRRWFGARIAYATWWLVPLAMLAVLLPPPVRELSILTRTAAVAMGIAPLQATAPTQSMPSMYPLFALVWSFGTLFAANAFHRMQRHYLRALGTLARREDGVFVSQSAGRCPAVVGAWKPRIVVPSDFDCLYPLQEGEMVLAHERAHLRRGDTIANLAAVVLRCLYWFNPVLHWAAYRFRQDQEMACDAMVLGQFPNRRRSYAEAMLKTQLAVLGLPVGCHWQSSQLLKERIAMLKQPLPGLHRLRVGILCIAFLAGTASYTAWALQPGEDGPTTQPRADSDGAGLQVGTETLVYSGNVSARMGQGAGGSAENRPVEIKHAPPPPYPAEPLAHRQSGKVVLIVDVGADGAVTQAQVDPSHPPSPFDAAALAAVKLWRFVPAMEAGKAVPGRVMIPITFEAEKGAEGGSDPGNQHAWYRQEAPESRVQSLACDKLVVEQDDKTGNISSMACGIAADTTAAK